MFERHLEAMVATVYFDDKGADAWRENGVMLVRGPRVLPYASAADLVEQMQRLLPSVPKYQYKRCLATMNGIKNAFGPEFWEHYPHATPRE